MDVADLDHGLAGFNASFVVLAVATTATVPGVRSLHHPTFLQGGEAANTLRTLLDFDPPARTMFLEPSLQSMVVIFIVAENDRQPGEVLGGDFSQESRCCDTIVGSRFGDQHRHQQSQGVDQQMPLSCLRRSSAPPRQPPWSSPIGCRYTWHWAWAPGLLGYAPGPAKHRGTWPKYRRRATGQSIRRRYSWKAGHAEAYPTGNQCGSGTRSY